MKKRILLLSIVLVSFTAFSFAADAPAISKNAISSFNKQFSNRHLYRAGRSMKSMPSKMPER